MKKLLFAFILLSSIIASGVVTNVYSKPAVSCLVNCNKLFIGFDPITNNVEGSGYLNCGSGNQFCEFYTLLSIWYYDNNEQLTYLTSFCSGGALNCGVSNYPILDSPTTLQPGYKYVVVFSVYDVNRGCGTCGNPSICNAACSINKTINLR